MTARIAVLASGGGSNLQAILDHFATLGDAKTGEIVLVASNRPDAYALERARLLGVAAEHLPATDEDTLLRLFERYRIDLIVLAGYLKLIPEGVTRAFRDRIINVHPGPLPQFGGAGMYGRRVHRAVLEAGVAQSGVTVHFVDDRYDHGAVIAQWPVTVEENDTAETLAARVLKVEHVLYPRIVETLSALFVSSNSSL